MTKQEMINQIQELANEYLGHGSLCFDNYIRIKKDELQKRLETAIEMIEVKRKAESIRAKHSPQEWKVAVVFPGEFPKSLTDDMETYSDLRRQANDLWLKV